MILNIFAPPKSPLIRSGIFKECSPLIKGYQGVSNHICNYQLALFIFPLCCSSIIPELDLICKYQIIFALSLSAKLLSCISLPALNLLIYFPTIFVTKFPLRGDNNRSIPHSVSY